MFIPTELKNPSTKPALEDRIIARKETEAKATTGKVGASCKTPPSPKIGELDKANVNPTRGSKRGDDTLTNNVAKKKNFNLPPPPATSWVPSLRDEQGNLVPSWAFAFNNHSLSARLN